MTSCEGKGSNMRETNDKSLKIKKKIQKLHAVEPQAAACSSPDCSGPEVAAALPWGPAQLSAANPAASDQCSGKPPAAASVPRQAAPSSQARKRFVTGSSCLFLQAASALGLLIRCSPAYWFSVGLHPIPSAPPQSDRVCSLIGCGAGERLLSRRCFLFKKV